MTVVNTLLVVICMGTIYGSTAPLIPRFSTIAQQLNEQPKGNVAPVAQKSTTTSTRLVSDRSTALPKPTVAKQEAEAIAAKQPTQEQINLYTGVAARSLGEGSFALPEIACTIKNRLRVSGSPLSAVLRAYHAKDIAPNAEHIEVVRQVFEGELPCPATWWYALSLQDTTYWRPHNRGPAKVIKQNERKQILIFDR